MKIFFFFNSLANFASFYWIGFDLGFQKEKPPSLHLLFNTQHNFKTLHPEVILINNIISS